MESEHIRMNLGLFDAQGAPQPGEAPETGAQPEQGARPDADALTPEEKAKAFRALIRGEYREQYASETQKLINRRFRETEALKRRVAELEGQGEELASAEGELPGESPRPAKEEAATEGNPAPAKPDPASDEAKERALAAHNFAVERSALWQRQAAALAARQPDFDLDAMRADPTFALLLTHGVPLERAWRAATVEARERAAAAEAERCVAADIRACGTRPPEAGGGTQGVTLRADASRLTDAEVLDVLARLSRRERVSFG